MDNLNTHTTGSFYETFPLIEAKRLCGRFEFIYTPKQGNWLNIPEIELNILSGQCLKMHIDTIDIVKNETDAWQKKRNSQDSKINWQFTTG